MSCSPDCCRPSIRITHEEFHDVPAMVLASSNSIFGKTEQEVVERRSIDTKDKDWRWNGKKGCAFKEPQAVLKHLEFLESKFFASFRFFWGRGNVFTLPPEGKDGDWESIEARLRIAAGSKFRAPEDATVSGPYRPLGRASEDPECQCCDPDCRVTLCCTAPGMLWDFCYYSANNHPLHGIFSHSPLHRLSTLERICMEITTISFGFFTCLLKTKWVDERDSPFPFFNEQSDAVRKYMFSLLVVTLPGMIMWRFNWMAFTTPCFIVDKAKATSSKKKFCGCLAHSAEVLGYVFCLVSIAFIVFDIFFREGISGKLSMEDHIKHSYAIAFTRAQAYILEWAIMLGLYFNPWFAWGHSDVTPGTKSCLVTYVADNLGLGGWRIQKQEFQNNCIHALEKIELIKESHKNEAHVEEAPQQHCFNIC